MEESKESFKPGKLQLKGGNPWAVAKKKKKKVKNVPVEGAETEAGAPTGTGSAKAKAPSTGISVQSGKSYEQEFASEIGRALEGKVKNVPWGSSFRAPPEILHGYSEKVTGKTAEERLDMRAAMKTDKFCK